jgi:8-oxo-dGTP pyrophosphatase MutT (NUDIX family)
MIYSSGIVLARGSGPTLQILMGHSTHKNPASTGDRRWTFFKGKVEEKESLWETAKREFREECGFQINRDDDFKSICYDGKEPGAFFSYKVGSRENRKKVYAHMLFDDKELTRDFKFQCDSFIGKTDYYEIDDFIWANPTQAKRICMPSQQDLFNHIYDLSHLL